MQFTSTHTCSNRQCMNVQGLVFVPAPLALGQGHDEPFLEQWHQKLHTNTTPDDVTICEAYLAYLHRYRSCRMILECIKALGWP